jgi:spore coat protein A
MKFIVDAEAGHTAPLPATLRAYTRLLESQASTHRTLELDVAADACTGDRWLINGLGWDDVTEYPYLGTVEVWSFVNRSGSSHPMHLHHSPFQVLDRQNFQIVDGQVTPTGPRFGPAPHELGWKDTVRADPGQITRVIVRFDDYAGLFAYHCHILEHEDNEMMRQMMIVPCPADFNQDGGVDGGDVEAFYLVWVTGESEGDVNRDGGVDGADVEAFFVLWEAGGC